MSTETSPATTFDAAAFRRAVVDRSVPAAIFLMTLVATGLFNPKLFDKSWSDVFQQAATEGAWLVVVLVGLATLRLDAVRWRRSAGLLVALIFFAVLSSLWAVSAAGPAALAKAGALAFNFAAVWLLAATRPFDETVEAIVAGLAVLIFASVGLAVLVPEIGLVDTWQHAGQWAGVFDQKQSLGITAAVLLFLAVMSFQKAERPAARLWYGVVALAAIAAMLGAESRGGLVLGAGAAVLGIGARRSRLVSLVGTLVPFAALCVALVMMVMLAIGDRPWLEVGPWDIDLTERTKIWKHALDNLGSGDLVFGAGLNGFWTRKEVADSFLGTNSWFLDNFHDGYLAIWAECGAVGMAIFVALTAAMASTRPRADANPREIERKTLILGFMALFYIINLTETYTLRATNLVSVLFYYFAFVLFSSLGEGEDPPTA